MSYIEALRSIATAWTNKTFTSWDTLMNVWLDEDTSAKDLAKASVKAWQGQFIGNYTAWSRLLAMGSGMPTVTITGRVGSMNNEAGYVLVAPRLTPAVDLEVTDLQQFADAGETIDAGDVDVTRKDFGQIEVKVTADDPAPAGIYRGLVLYQEPTMGSPEPLAWVVIVIAP